MILPGVGPRSIRCMVSPPATHAEPASAVTLNRRLAVLAVAGAAGWATFAVMITGMLVRTPPGAGFDFELLLTGGRRVASGLSPYEPAMLAGQSVGITTLFFSYPPLVAQALVPLAGVPSFVVLGALLVAGPLAASAVSGRVARLHGAPLTARDAFLVCLTLLPFWFPFTLAMLFGNLDVLFLAGYGLLLLGVVPASPSRGSVIAAGVALALMSVTKLHPVVLGVWLVARGVREWRGDDERVWIVGPALPRSWAIAAVSVAVALVVLAASLLVGGLGPWADYLTVLRASTVVDLLDPRNLGPAVQLALLFGLGHDALAPMQGVLVALALGAAVVSALAVNDPIESILWAAFASLVPLPVTWFHHFAVLFPFGVAAVSRAWVSGAARRRVTWLMALALAIGAIGFGQVFAWLLVPVFVIAVRLSRGPCVRQGADTQAGASAAASAG